MSVTEADKLVRKYAKLRDKVRVSKDPELLKEFKRHEDLCIIKFRYLVHMKTGRYKHFNNYDDLNQEGLEALLKALNSYDPEKGSCFWWMHKYIDTRIARCANLHTTIRFPLKYAKAVTPHRESNLPVITDGALGPHDILEQSQILAEVKKNFDYLPGNQKEVMRLLFGMDGEPARSISQVCRKLKISRPVCIKMIDQVIGTLKKNVQI